MCGEVGAEPARQRCVQRREGRPECVWWGEWGKRSPAQAGPSRLGSDLGIYSKRVLDMDTAVLLFLRNQPGSSGHRLSSGGQTYLVIAGRLSGCGKVSEQAFAGFKVGDPGG